MPDGDVELALEEGPDGSLCSTIMPDGDVELALEEGPDGSTTEKEDEEARQFILKVKKTIERCLQQGMNKAEMLRVIREEGLPTWIAFAVFKELRAQNHDFFKEYYTMHDLKKQREKLGRLIQAYRAGGGGSNASAGARAPETATTAAAAMETDTTAGMEWSDQQAKQDWCDELARLLAGPIGGGGDQFAGDSLTQQQVVHRPGGGQQPHHDEQAVCEWLREMGRPSGEEAVPVPVPAQSVANGMFQGVTWPQQAAGQQLLYHQEQAGHLPAGQQQLRYQELEVCFPADPPPRYLEQAVSAPLPAGLQLHYQQEQDLPAMPQLHYQQQPLHLPAEQQLMANGGFQGAPLALAADLAGRNIRMLSQGGIGWGQEQPAGFLRQRWPGAGADPSPSSTLPGGEQQQLGNQNFHSSNAGIYERPQ